MKYIGKNIIMDICVGAKHSETHSREVSKNQTGNASPLREWPCGTKPGSLSAIMQNFIGCPTRKINHIRRTPGERIWQRNYYDRIIRNKTELLKIREYIINNPLKWELDKDNPANWQKGNEFHD